MIGSMRLNINGCRAVLTWPSVTEEEPCYPVMDDGSSLSGDEQSVSTTRSCVACATADSQHYIEIDDGCENVSCMFAADLQRELV